MERTEVQLTRFDVEGYRSLDHVDGIPVAKPAILTGHNDAGKSAALRALGLLLGNGTVVSTDYTFATTKDPLTPRASTLVDDEESPETILPEPQVVITGTFALDPEEQAQHCLGAICRVRRVFERRGPSYYEVEREEPTEPNLAGLDALKLPELKERCKALGIEPSGPGTQKASWLGPLVTAAQVAPKSLCWTAATKDLAGSLPRFVFFSSTAEPDPQAEVRAALAESFSRHIADATIAGKVLAVEKALTLRLTDDAGLLRTHILSRCRDLASVSITPQVSIREGFAGVELCASRREGESVDLQSAGAGRKRLITLAIWEWVSELLERQPSDDGIPLRSLVVAYDEPDTHLDYARQRELMDLFRTQCSQPSVRMIVATHSLNLIDRVDISDIAHLSLENDRTSVERLLSDEDAEVEAYLSDVSLSMGLRNSTLLHERCFVIVEGATEQQCLPLLFRLVHGLPMQSMGLALVAADGNQGALRVAGHLKRRKREVVLVLDRDTTNQDSTKKMFRPDRLRGEGFDPDRDVMYLGKAELEDLFTDEQWASVANAKWRREDGADWQPRDIASLREEPKFSESLQRLFQAESSGAPTTKPAMLEPLVRGLASASEVPAELAAVLESLARLTAAPPSDSQ